MASTAGIAVADPSAINEENPLTIGSLLIKIPAGTADQNFDFDLKIDEVKITGLVGGNPTELTTTDVIDGVLTLGDAPTPPTIAITTADDTLTIGETAVITFTLSEAATDFTVDDVTVSGGALSGFSGSGAAYTATFTPTENSTTAGVVSVAAGTFTDAEGDASTAAASVNMTVDTRDTSAPTIQITTADDTLTAGETAVITFTLSEAATDFTAEDVTVSGGALSGFTGSGTSYTATFSPEADSTDNGIVTVAAGAFTDAAGNASTTGASVTMNVNTFAPPTVTIVSDDDTLGVDETAKITFTLSEASTDFSVEDVTVSGGSLNGFEGSGTTYTAIFSPATDITTNGGVSVAAGTFTDAVGTANDTGANISIAVDTQAPTVALATSGNGNTLTPGTTETITVTLSEGSEDFGVEDLTPNGGELTNFTANSPTEYTAVFVPAAQTETTGSVAVAAGSFSDSAGNTNSNAAVVTMRIDTVDLIAPTVGVSTDNQQLGVDQTATVTFELSEASSDFTANDVTVSGGTLGDLTPTSATTYTAIFTPTENSTTPGVVSIAAETFADAAGNKNNETASITFEVNTVPPDTTGPTVTIASGDTALTSGETANITFTLSEDSEDFNVEDITVSGGALSAFTGSGTSYTATFTPTANSTADGVVSVAAGSFTDAAGNASTGEASVTMAVNTDNTPPTIAISTVDDTLEVGETALIGFTLSEASTDFKRKDVTVAGGTLSNFEGSGTAYTATFTPAANSTADGVISVAAGTFTDSAGNASAEAASVTMTVTLQFQFRPLFLFQNSPSYSHTAGRHHTCTQPDHNRCSRCINGWIHSIGCIDQGTNKQCFAGSHCRRQQHQDDLKNRCSSHRQGRGRNNHRRIQSHRQS